MSPSEAALALVPDAVGVAAPRPAPVPEPARAPQRPRPTEDVHAILSDLHARHGKELLGFCRWMLKDPDEAADAVQDTWIRAMTALGDAGVRVVMLRPWLYAIARNVCLDRLRQRKRESLYDLSEEDGGEAPSADHVAELRQQAAAALALVASLSERQRQALLMREVAGMDVADIASTLGVTPERAAWTIADARKTIEEARSGSRLDCADVRARLGAGGRGRGLRSHLEACGECRTHAAKLRVRRVLAPAILPFFWLRRASLPLLTKPTAAAVMAGIAAAGLPIAEHSAGRPERPVAPRTTLVEPAVTRPFAPPSTPDRRGLHDSARHTQRLTPARRHAAPSARAGAGVSVSTTAGALSASPAEKGHARPVGAARPVPAKVVRRVTASVAATVHGTLRRVEHASERTTARVPGTDQVVSGAVDAADDVVGSVLG